MSRWDKPRRLELCWYETWVVIISITRYRDIDRGFIERTISWRRYIVRYHARTHVSCVRCSHTAAAASASDWCRLPCKPSVAPSASRSCGRPIMQRIGSLGWGLGNGSRTSGGLNYAYRKADCARPRSVKVVMISTLQCLSSVHSLWYRLLLRTYTIVGWTSQCNVTPVLVTKPLLRLIHAVS